MTRVVSEIILVLLAFVPASVVNGQVCKNDHDFRIPSNGKSCAWVRWNEDRRQLLCTTDATVRATCPQSCGDCCEDEPDYRFFNNPESVPDNGKSCAWITDKISQRKKWCEHFDSEINVKEACPKACKICKEKVASPLTATPTKAPTDGTPAPTESRSPTPRSSMRPSSDREAIDECQSKLVAFKSADYVTSFRRTYASAANNTNAICVTLDAFPTEGNQYCVGDTFIIDLDIYDETAESVIGNKIQVVQVVSADKQFNEGYGSFTFINEGEIFFQSHGRGATARIAITSGTGNFIGARGEVIFVEEDDPVNGLYRLKFCTPKYF